METVTMLSKQSHLADIANANYPIFVEIQQLREIVIPNLEPILEILYKPVTTISNLGPDETSVSIFISYLSIFALSLLLSLIKTPSLRMLYSSSLGLFFGFYCNGFGYSYVLLSYLAVQLTIYLFPSRPIVLLFIYTVPSRRLAYITGNIIALFFLLYANWIDFQLGFSLKGLHFLLCSLVAFSKQNMLLTNYYDASLHPSELSSRERHLS